MFWDHGDAQRAPVSYRIEVIALHLRAWKQLKVVRHHLCITVFNVKYVRGVAFACKCRTQVTAALLFYEYSHALRYTPCDALAAFISVGFILLRQGLPFG